MKKVLGLVFILLVVAILGVLIYLQPQLKIVTGFTAKKACSYHFIAERSLESIKEIDLEAFPMNLVSLELTSNPQGVVSSVLGMQKAQAIVRKGLGCTLLQGKDDFKISKLSENPKPKKSSSLPRKDKRDIDQTVLDLAFKSAFDSEDEWKKKTLGLMILHKDTLLQEKYLNGFDSETEFLGWSMSKSVANLLVGIGINQGLLDLNESNLYPAWENDERKNITLQNLLQMNSGLQWTEEYEDVCDITQGLFEEEDFVKFTWEKPLESDPGTVYEYSSGTTNLISGILRRKFESYQDYLNFPHKYLFEPLGIGDAYMETDEAGNYIMSSYMHAKARDWAKLGMVYKNKGSYNGTQIVDSLYIDWSLSPSGPESGYGAQIFLNTEQKQFKTAPESAYKFSGYDGQYVVIIPSHDLIIVRFGLSKGPHFDLDKVIDYAIKAVT